MPAERYITTGRRVGGYQHRSELGGAWEDTRTILRIGLIPGIIGMGLCLIATVLIVAIGG
jgi:hypothetical protein